jgi:hypothetical protein
MAGALVVVLRHWPLPVLELAGQRDQPPQRREPVVLYSGQEADELPQRPDGNRRADAVAAPGLDSLVGPDDRGRTGLSSRTCASGLPG